jgi:Class-II DAHP synthetase family
MRYCDIAPVKGRVDKLETHLSWSQRLNQNHRHIRGQTPVDAIERGSGGRWLSHREASELEVSLRSCSAPTGRGAGRRVKHSPAPRCVWLRRRRPHFPVERIISYAQSGACGRLRLGVRTRPNRFPSMPTRVRSTIERRLASTAPLVTPGEIRRLREHLAGAARGEAFVIQGGDCAETFEATSLAVLQGTVRTLQQMAFLISMATCQHVITIGRIAGQFAKPRSSSTETRMGRSLASYQGDIINGREFTGQNREACRRRTLLHRPRFRISYD